MTGNLDSALARARAFLEMQDERRQWRKERAEIMAERDQLQNEIAKWLIWSDGHYPDESPGDVIAAEYDGTITLDDGITTWNPLRALAFFHQQIERIKEERDRLIEQRRRLLILSNYGCSMEYIVKNMNHPDWLTNKWLENWYGEPLPDYIISELDQQNERGEGGEQ